MKRELVERAHDQARAELGFCVQATDGYWCDAHACLMVPGEEACRAMARAYIIAESAVEVAEPLIRADEQTKKMDAADLAFLDAVTARLEMAEIGERIAEAIEVKADDLDWDGAVATKGELEAVRDYAVTVLHEAAAIARACSDVLDTNQQTGAP